MSNWKHSSELKTLPITKNFFENTQGITLCWLASAGFLLNINGCIVLIDPVIMHGETKKTSEIGMQLAVDLPILATEIPRVDYVLYTHPDNDHLAIKTALALAKKGATFVGTYASYYKLTQNGVSPKQCKVCRYYDPFILGEIIVDITPCDHPWQLKDLNRGGLPYRFGDCCGFIINTDGGRIFFPGDTRLMEEHLRIKDISWLALDVSLDENHLTHQYAAVLANCFGNAKLIPIHYGSYITNNSAQIGEPSAAYALINNSKVRGLMPNPGEVIKIEK